MHLWKHIGCVHVLFCLFCNFCKRIVQSWLHQWKHVKFYQYSASYYIWETFWNLLSTEMHSSLVFSTILLDLLLNHACMYTLIIILIDTSTGSELQTMKQNFFLMLENLMILKLILRVKSHIILNLQNRIVTSQSSLSVSPRLLSRDWTD